jgi:Flp pilus assembly protein TadG
MTAVLIVVLIGFCGFALDLSRLYNRKVELQTVADTIALAAAAQLNGTKEGIDSALSAAAEAGAKYAISYAYGKSPVVWSPDAIRFSSASSGSTWVSAADAKAQPDAMFYVEVDTSRLNEAHGHVGLLLLPVLPSASTAAQTGSRAIAGRSTINVMPLAVCAMSDARASQRGQELVEYGFRRGISYNLMQLNPDENSKGAHFLVNPLAAPGTTGTSDGTKLEIIKPFVCAGALDMPQVTAGKITVVHGFPLSSVAGQINSRFGSPYAAPCTENGAPPDTSIKEYTGALSWMVDKPKGQSADPRKTDTKMLTLADLPLADIPVATTPDLWGPLWIYAKPAKYSEYKTDQPEPEPAGYLTFAPGDWSTLYTPGPPVLKGNYPGPSPHKAAPKTGGARSVANRRVLNIPLLRCPVPPSSPAPAEVLAIGKFFMTIKATESELFAEFAGLARPGSLGGQVELYK